MTKPFLPKTKYLSIAFILAFFLFGFTHSAFAGHKHFSYQVGDETTIGGEFSDLNLGWAISLPERRGKDEDFLRQGRPEWPSWHAMFRVYQKIESPYESSKGKLIQVVPACKVVFKSISFIDLQTGLPLDVYYGSHENQKPLSFGGDDFTLFSPGLEMNYTEKQREKLQFRVVGNFKMETLLLKYHFVITLPEGKSKTVKGEKELRLSSKWYKTLP